MHSTACCFGHNLYFKNRFFGRRTKEFHLLRNRANDVRCCAPHAWPFCIVLVSVRRFHPLNFSMANFIWSLLLSVDLPEATTTTTAASAAAGGYGNVRRLYRYSINSCAQIRASHFLRHSSVCRRERKSHFVRNFQFENKWMSNVGAMDRCQLNGFTSHLMCPGVKWD